MGLGRVGSECFFHLGLFGTGVAVAAGGLAVELLAGELEESELGPDRDCRRWSFCEWVDMEMSWSGAVSLCARHVAVDRFGGGWKSCTYFEVEKGLLEARHGDGVVFSLVPTMQEWWLKILSQVVGSGRVIRSRKRPGFWRP